MEWQGGINKSPTTGNGVGASSLEIRTGNFSKSDMYLSPNLMLSRVRSMKHFFRNALSRAHLGVLIPTSLWLGPIDTLPFATVIFWLHFFFFFWKEKHGKKTPLSTFHCNQLQHTRSACFKTDLPDYFDSILFKSLLSHAGQLSCCDVMEVTWPKHSIFSCRRRRCSKRHVFIQINTFTYLRKLSIYQMNSVNVKLCIVQSKWYLRLKISVQGPFKGPQSTCRLFWCL